MAGNVQVKRSTKKSDYTEREWIRINARDRAERAAAARLGLVLAFMLLLTAVLGYMVYYMVFRSHDYELVKTYSRSDTVFGMPGQTANSGRAQGFAAGLCVTDRDVNLDAIPMGAYSAGLFDMDGSRVVYAKDIFTTRYPASITKIMTALLAMKYGNMDDIVEVTETALDIEYGSSVCDIKVGDRLTMRQLLYGMMIASGNDAAMMIAEHIGGSVGHFVEMMNQEALSLGATRTHFTNPHGLTDEQHYTCVYDIYLMAREAMKYDMFMDIINRKNFYAEYTDSTGSPTAVTWETTNHYFTGEAEQPDDVIIFGGKTGTTDEAGACLALVSKDLYGNPYLSVILHAENKEELYREMNTLLGLVSP